MATDDNRDEIEQLIRQSCKVPSADDEFIRSLAARARHELLATLPEGPKDELLRLREKSAALAWRRVAIAVAGLAAAILVSVLLWNRQEGVAWAQVAQSVRAMPWIHMKAVGGEGQSQESWASFSRDIGAMRDSDMIRYDDFLSGTRWEYNLKQKKLFRLSVSGEELFKSEEGLFQAIVRGNAIRAEDFGGGSIVKQQQRTVTEQGRRWIVYELELQRQGDGPKPPIEVPTTTVVIRVNPEKKLPESMTVTQGKKKMEATFDYPAQGPADIYALGVPRDAPIEDRTPPPDLERILKLVQKNRRDFGNYLAVAGGDEPSIVRLIRCKGDKFRVDVGIGDTKRVTSGTEMGKWWWEHGKEVLLEGSVLCDGRRVYRRSLVGPETGWRPLMIHVRQGDDRATSESVGDSAHHFVDLLAYSPTLSPENLASVPWLTVRLDLKGEDGPAGSVRVERLIANRGGPDDRSTYQKEEFWLQPKYGYAVVKYVLSGCPEVDEDPRRKEKAIIYEYDDFRQTPRGLWYPTVSRWKNASQSENKNKPGGIEFHDKVTYFYLAFTAELPDELFSTAWKGDLLVGIHFAPRKEKPTPNDLGQIRPPGGVPLVLGVPGQPISVEAVNRSKQRLEAAPPADLERWVVELERIIGKKLKDGLPSARQVCRTDFVNYMSVAFDGLKWNAKRADNLFQRAQTLPASEARVWKEAFEVLLEKEIGQTDTSICPGGPAWAVPLVLIPVDALYDGEKYSPKRAKKYLARMKQLTADDVSLWKDKVDQWGGTKLDAAMNIILLDEFFEKEEFQRDKFRAAIEAKKKN